MELTIREMQEPDLLAVAALEARIFTMPWSENGFRASLKSKDTVYLTAWLGDTLAGYCGLLQSFDEADITNVAVASECRNQGVGGRMLTELMRRGGERGIKNFTLEVRAGNAPAIHLYERLGFVSAGIRKNFYERPTEDAVIMWRT